MRLKFAILALLVTLAAPLTARADTINFTQSMTASGFINGVAFDNKSMTITATYSTDDVFHRPVSTIDAVVFATLIFTVADVGTFIDTDDQTYVAKNGQVMGTGSAIHSDLLLGASVDFIPSDLEHPLDPVVTQGITPAPNHLHHSGAKANTAAGLFELDSTSSVTTTLAFATDTPPTDPPPVVTPEPSSLTLLGTGLLGFSTRVLRKFRRKRTN